MHSAFMRASERKCNIKKSAVAAIWLLGSVGNVFPLCVPFAFARDESRYALENEMWVCTKLRSANDMFIRCACAKRATKTRQQSGILFGCAMCKEIAYHNTWRARCMLFAPQGRLVENVLPLRAWVPHGLGLIKMESILYEITQSKQAAGKVHTITPAERER